jgi:hypothetical protein
MPKRDAPRASADTAIGQARRKRHLRNPSPVPIREPQPHHGAGTDLQMPAWLPPPVASYARQVSCRTDTDKLLLCRLTSDPRMRGVWTELLKRKRSNYKSSDTFKYPATAGMDWDPKSREMLRRAQTIRRMSDPNNNYEANKIEARVKLQWAAETATWVRNYRRCRSVRWWLSSLKHLSLPEPIPDQSPKRNEDIASKWPAGFGPMSQAWIRIPTGER